MKKLAILLAASLLCLTAAAWAEETVNVEVISVDGISVVMLTPGMAPVSFLSADRAQSGIFVLPGSLIRIGESAFEGIAAEKVEVTENVAEIAARAFADCRNLKEITIPASVEKD